MDSHPAGIPLSLPMGILLWIWSWTGGAILCALSKAKIAFCESADSIFVAFGLYLTGLPSLLNHMTIGPRYWSKVIFLTIWAFLSGRSFIVHRTGHLPHFIARPSSKDLHVFNLTHADIHFIYRECGVHVRTYPYRNWRPEWKVAYLLNGPNMFNQPPLPLKIDITSHQLIGQRLTQGRGIIGHGICAVLIEEYGRWPGKRGVIGGKLFTWDGNELVHGKIPVQFVATPGVRETVENEETVMTVEWQDLESGMAQGLKAIAVTADPLDIPPLLPILE